MKNSMCKIKKFVTLVLLFLFLVIIYFWSGYRDKITHPNFKIEKSFLENLDNSIKKGKKSVFLKELTDFKWEKVCVFRPYSLYSDHEDIFGNDFLKFPDIPWGEHEGINTLAFAYKKEFIALIRIYRKNYGEFLSDNACYNYSDATIEILGNQQKSGCTSWSWWQDCLLIK